MNVIIKPRCAALAALIVILVGCGGGGGGGGETSSTNSTSTGNSTDNGSSSGGSTTSTGWTGIKQLGAAPASITTDASGNIYVVGTTYVGLDGNTLAGTNDFFLIKFNSSGEKQYTKQLGAFGQQTFGKSVALDPSGNVYVTGYTTGSLDGNTQSGYQTYEMFLTKYNSSGEKQFTKQRPLGQCAYGWSVTTDSNGNVYVAGQTIPSPLLGCGSLTGGSSAFITKYNSSGVIQYTRTISGGGATVTSGSSVVTDTSGNAYVAGYTSGALLNNALSGSEDVFLVKYNATGDVQFTKQFGATNASSLANGAAIDNSGNVYLVGSTTGSLDGNTLAGWNDFILIKYSSSGDRQYTKQLGVALSRTTANSVATDTSGNIYVVGSTTGGLDGNTLAGDSDYFLTKFDNTGAKQFTKQVGVARLSTAATSVVTGVDNSIYIAGNKFISRYNTSGEVQ